jgi:hypothetical protein
MNVAKSLYKASKASIIGSSDVEIMVPTPSSIVIGFETFSPRPPPQTGVCRSRSGVRAGCSGYNWGALGVGVLDLVYS